MGEKNKNVKVEIFPSTTKEYATYDQQAEKQITDIIHNKVLPREKREYRSVKVKVKRKADGKPKALIAYMLRKDTYTADTVKIEVNDNYEVQKVVDDYVSTEDEDVVEDKAGTAYDTIDFVVGTPVPNIPTAKAAVEAIYQMALAAGLKAKLLEGPDANVANYKGYLASGLRGFVNIGHGNTDLIVLSDGVLDSNWLNSQVGKPIYPAVVYFNSCLVFNNPFQPAMMNAGARTFVGGITTLLIGPSEEVCKCFWSKVLTQNVAMGQALKDCELAKYPTQGNHGICGDLGYFTFIQSMIDNYVVTFFGENGSTGSLVAAIYGYNSNNFVLNCQFYREGTTIAATDTARWGYITLVYPWSRFSAIIDVLRNEKPIYTLISLPTKYGYISTSLEPVGEAEK